MNKLRASFFFFFTLISLAGLAAPPGYSYYKLCTTQENQITVGIATLNNFPVLVRITDVDLRSTGNGGYVQNSNGFDIIYTAADGNTIIPFQLESYDAVTGTVVAWVNVPVVSAIVNSDFYMYFGNSSVITNQSSTATWDANYRAVYHLHNNENDGTANGFNLTNSATTNQPAAVAADGQDIEPTQFLRYSATNGLNIAGNVTLETWISFETFRNGQFQNVLFADGVNGEAASQNVQYYFNYYGGGVNNNKLQAYWESGAGTDWTVLSTAVAPPGLNTWHHVVMVRDAVNKTVTFYFDGLQLGAVVPYGTNPTGGANATLQIGREHPTSGNQIDGDFDESRISNSIRTPEWIQATYQTSMPASTFVQYGPTNCLFMNVADAGSNQVLCITSPDATMAGNNPIVAGTGTWSLVSGSGTITSPTSPTTTITGIGLGANVFQWTLSNGPCTASSANVTVTVNPAPTTADAGLDQTICANSTSLNGNTPIVGTGTWTLVSGSGVITSPSSPTSTVTGLGIGANVFQWTISNIAPCASSIDQVTITQNAVPTIADAGPDQTLCSGNSLFAGNVPAVGVGTWTLISGTGIPTTPSSATSAVTGLSVGANVFEWTITNGVCPSSSDQLTITRDPNPTVANAGPDQNVCISSASTTMAGNTPAVGTGVWSLISGTGVITTPSSELSGVTGLGLGPDVFQWTISNGTCPSSIDLVTITTDDFPTVADAGSDQTICSSSSSFNGNTPVVGSGTWTLISGSGVITLPSSPTSGVTGLGVGANVFQWSISNGACPPSTDQVMFTVDPNPTVANAGVDQTICSGVSTFTGNVPIVGSGIWTLISGSGVITSPTSATSGVTGLSVGVNVFQWTISNGTCPSSSDQVTIMRDPVPTIADAGLDQTVCATSTSFTGNTPVVGSGIWTLVSGSGVITLPTSPTSGVTGLGVGANVFQWSISNGTCPPSTDQVTITRNANPTVANAGVDQTICSGNSAFTGNIPAVGVGTWTLISGTGIPTTPSSATSAVTGLSVGANVFQWTISNGVCPSSSDQVTITRDPVPTIADAGLDQTVCATSTSFTGNTPVVGSGIWTLVSGSGVITLPTSPTSGVTGLGVGANVFQWSISNGTCPPSTDQVTITRNANPTVANAGVDQTICSGNSAFTGNIPAVGVGTWTLISGTGIPTTPSSATSAVTGLSVGANVFQWTISNGVCPSSSDQVTITRDPVPTIADAGLDQTVCATSTSFTGNTPVVGSGIWTLVSGSGVITLPTSPTSGVTGLGVGANVFQWSISNGTCPPSTDQVTITRNANPTVANAGVDQTICSGNSAFTGNIPAVGVGTWTLISGTGIPTTPSSATSAVTGLSVGANVFQWTISNGVCPSSSDQVTITRDPVPTISNAGPDQHVCISSAAATMAGNVPLVGSGTWTLISGSGVITSPSSPTSGVTGLGAGANVFEWRISNGTCPSSSDLVTITVDDFPTTANAGPDQSLCSNSTSLAGNIPVAGIGNWTLISGSAVITLPSSPGSGITGMNVGSNIFKWTISNGSCPSSSDQVDIFVDSIPTTANAGPDQIICSSSSSLAGNTPLIGSGSWTLISGAGIPTTPSSPTSGVTGLSVGANVFQWTISNGICPSNSDQVTLTVDPNPTPANAGVDQSLCTNATALSGNTPLIGTGIWTLVSGSGVITSPSSPTSGVSVLGVGANTFQWTISNGTCSPSSDQVVITVDPIPTIANAGADQTICSSSSSFAGNIALIGTGTWTLVSGSGVITSPNSPTSPVTGLAIGSNVFQWTISNGICPSNSDQVTINVDANPTTANAGIDQTICSSTVTLTANIPVIGTGLWTLVSGAGTITSPSSATTGVTALGIGSNVFQWTISNGTCAASFDQVIIRQDANPTPANAGPDQVICSASSVFAGNIPLVGTGTWTLVSGSGIPGSPNSNTSAVNGLGIGTNVFQWTTANGTCPSTSDQVNITVDANPTTANAGPDQSVCASSTVLAGNLPVTGTGNWTLVSGSGVITLPTSPTSGVTGLGVGPNIFQWTISNGSCAASFDQVTIVHDANPTIANAGPDQTICSTSSLFAGNIAVTGSGTWTLVSGSGVITSPLSPTSGVTGLGIGTNVFQWTIANGSCPSTSDQVTINVDASPTVANAGIDQEVCSSATSLAGNLPLTGSGVWTLVSGSGVITLPTSPTSGVTGLGVGANVFQWTISNGSCTASFDQVTITHDSTPTIANAGPDQTICSSSALFAGNIPLVGTGTWTLISGSGIPGSPNSNTSAINGLGIGANVFEWTISNGVCPSTNDQVIITVNQNPTLANAGMDQALCADSATMNATNVTVGSGVWALITGSGTIVSPNSPNTLITGLSVGANSFQWTTSNGTCPSTSDTVVVTSDAVPTLADAGVDQVFCQGSVSNFNGNVPLVGTGVWTLISGSGIPTTPSSATSMVTGLGIGQDIFQWTISNGVCPSTSDQVVISIDDIPSAANAGADQVVCASVDSVTLSGNVPVVGTGAWTLASGSGTITNPLLYNTTVSGLGLGINSFVWTISNGICAVSADTVAIQVDSIPSIAVAGPDQEVCGSAGSINLSANAPVTGIGTWSLVSGAGTITLPNSNLTSVTGLSVGVNLFTWSVSNGGCVASTDTVKISVDSIPTIPDAGFDAVICSNFNSVVLDGNVPSVGTGTWALVSGTGIIADSSLNTTNVTGLAFGPNLFTWTISGGVCGSLSDTVLITVDSVYQSIAGPDQSVCGSTSTVNLSGNIPVYGTGTWTIASGSGIIALPNSNATTVTGLSLGVNALVWTISSGVCSPSSDTMIVFVDSIPSTANAGLDQVICANTGMVVLNGNSPSVGTGTWSLVYGAGTISNPNSNSSAVNGLVTGTDSLVWTISNGVCASSVDTVVITVDPVPSTADAGPDQSVCGTTSPATLTGNIPVTGSGNWALIGGSGTIVNPAAGSTTVTGLSLGINSFTWTISNGACGASVDTISITVDSIPSVSVAGPDQTICSSAGTINLNGNIPTVGTGTWSTILGSGTIAFPNSAATTASGMGIGTNTFVWTISSGACGSTTDSVSVFVDAAPSTSVAGNPQSVCGDSTMLNAVPPVVGSGAWTLISGAGIIGNPAVPSTSVVGLIPGDNIFQYTISNGICPASSSSVTIHSDLPPDIAFAGIDFSVQNPIATLNGNTPVIGTGVWTIINGNGTFSSSTIPNPSVTGLATGPNEYAWTISNGACPSSSDSVIVTYGGIVIPNGFSPNGDGINDFWVIPGIQYYQEAKLTVFNKWGNIVFQSDVYQNDFDGNNQNKQELSDDTYYYTLELSPTESYSGFIVIKRKN